MANRSFTFAALFLASLSTGGASADVVRLDELSLDNIRQDWGDPRADKSVDANPITIAGKIFDHGVGTHASSAWVIELDGNAEKLTAQVGIDDEVARDPKAKRLGLVFKVVGENKILWQSPPMKAGDAPAAVEVALTGEKRITLLVTNTTGGVDYAHADWADAAIVFRGERPNPVDPPPEPREILTPPPAHTPLINGPSVFGVRPGHPVLFTVTSTGDRPMTFTADDLPEGVQLDSKTGRLTGSVAKAGTYDVKLQARNNHGTSYRTLKLVVGDRIALTPPMGWNSWNCFAAEVSDEKVRLAADALLTSGLADHGWTYINIDDCWQVPATEPREKRRDANGRVLTNAKFPDMKALVDYIHAKGLKAGTYSSPGEATCANFTGSYQHELDDATQYAAWGFDYLKYDWCSYGRVADDALHASKDEGIRHVIYKYPYDLMHEQLAKQPRDIVFSLCQYGWDHVSAWGDQAGGQLWRTTGDISDNWGSMSGIGFAQAENAPHAKPGNWNDSDMLVVGKVGWGPKLHDTHLTPNEQYTHITLWSLLSAPLLIGCDLTQMDDFTRSLLTNDEVIAVDQDALGKQATRVARDESQDTEVWAKDLEDGSKAVGLFNRGELPATVTVKWNDLGLTGPQQARDLWRQKDIESAADGYSVEVKRHGAALIRVAKK